MEEKPLMHTQEYNDAETEAAWQKFRNETVKANGKGHRVFKISGSWGIYDAYKHIRRNKWYDIGRPVTEKEFYAIVRQINNKLADEIGKGSTVILPSKMGMLELRKEPRGVTFDKKGNMKVTYPVDWQATLKLWFEDEEAREQKLLIRMNSRWVYRVFFNKYKATFNNKMFYDFTLNRFIKKKLKNNINNGLIDSVYDKKHSVYKH